MIEWFRHDTDARNDIKIRKLLRDNDPGALGAYWMCVEMIYQSGGYAEETAIAEELSFYNMDKFIPALVEHGLLEDVGNGVLTSQRVLSEIKFQDERRQKKVEAGRKGGLSTQAKSSTVKQCLSNAKAKVSNAKALSSTIQDNTKQINISDSSKDSSLVGQQADATFERKTETDLFGEKIPVEMESERIPYDEIGQYWNSKMKGKINPQIKQIDESRKTAIRQRWNEFKNEVYTAIDKVSESEFLSSRKSFGFDWCFEKKNMRKILEGNYENNSKPSSRYGNKSFKPHDINGQYDDEELEVITEL